MGKTFSLPANLSAPPTNRRSKLAILLSGLGRDRLKFFTFNLAAHSRKPEIANAVYRCNSNR